MIRTAALLVLAGASCASFGDVVDWIAGKEHTYIVLPPQSVTDGAVKTATYSSDGAYLLVGERPIIPDQNRALDIGKTDQAGSREGSLSLLVWDRLHRQIKSDWTSEDPTVQIDEVKWIHGTPTAIIVMHSTVLSGPINTPSTVWAVMALNAATGQFEWVSGLESLAYDPKVFVSPTKARAMVAFDDITQEPKADNGNGQSVANQLSTTITLEVSGQSLNNGGTVLRFVQPLRANNFIDLDGVGRVMRRVNVQPPIEQEVVWSSDGSRWFLEVGVSKTIPSGLEQLGDDGELQPVDDSPFKELETTADLSLFVEPQVAKHGKSAVNYNQHWLIGSDKADQAELLLTPNGEESKLSPTLDSVFTIEGGVAKVRLILALPHDAGEALREADKVRAQSQAQGQTITLDGRTLRISNLRFVVISTASTAPPDKP